ncbi:MAG: hypothetical protein HQL90_07700 [Magnetococcales bacterium]|nr:hypothetical protein [Magnetococcales bacterium]
MENAKETKNPLLETYGVVVDRCFVADKTGHGPVTIFPGVDSRADDPSYAPDLNFFDPGPAAMEAIQNSVDTLRTLLEKEATEAKQQGDQKKKFDNIADKVRAVRGQAEGIQQVNFHLEAFRQALQDGDESLLKGNPFYALAKLVFKHNLSGALVLFGSLMEELTSNAPEPVGQAERLRTLWSGSSQRGLAAKLLASLRAPFRHSKAVLDILLFVVSAFTSYRAWIALLQSPDSSAWFDHYFTPAQGETLQITLATLGAIALSFVILDFRARLLQGTAEMGAFFKGIRAAFLVQPRWIVLACCLTLFSVKTNYDSIAVLFSTGGHLSAQLTQIQQRVGELLGTAATGSNRPLSLYGFQAQLQTAVDEVAKGFEVVPDNELTGRDPRKGPRYFAKYFVVNGGFVPGSNDIAHSFRNIQFSRSMDQQLQESGIPFDQPVRQRLQTIAALYTADLEKSAATIQQHLAALDRLMQVGALSLPTMQKIYAFDTKQINLHIREIITALQANRAKFDQVVQSLDALAERYIKFLIQIDKSSEAHLNSLRIINHLSEQLDVPWENLPAAVQRPDQQSFAALTAFLNDHYGQPRGNLVLALILLLSFAIDLLPLLLFGYSAARQGRTDAQMADELLNYMKEWEDAFVELAKSFFYRPVIQQTFHGLTFPNETGVRNAFYKVLEGIDTSVKDIKDHRTVDQRRAWLRGLFVQPHTLHTMGYNARAGAIETFLTQKSYYFPLFIQQLFPGLPYGKKAQQLLDTETFLGYYLKTEAGQALDKEQFSAELRRLGGDGCGEPEPEEGLEESPPVTGLLSRLRQQVATQLGRISFTLPGRRPEVEVDQWTAMIQKAASEQPSPTPKLAEAAADPANLPRHILSDWAELILERAFREPFPRFPHTRRNWIISISSVREDSLEDLDTLHDFIPDFVKMLKKVMTNTLPVIQETLEPLEEICRRFPEQCAIHGIEGTAELKEQFRALEKESLGMWGACVSHLLGDGTPANALQTQNNPELAGLLAAGGDISQFYERIHTLMENAKEAAQRAKTVEETIIATIKHAVIEIKDLCDSINQMLVKINILSLALRRQRPLPQQKLRALNEGNAVLDRAPRDVQYILNARAKILANENLYSDENFSELSQLRIVAHTLHGRVDNILNLVDK